VIASFGAAQELVLPLLVVCSTRRLPSQKLDVVREYPTAGRSGSKQFSGLSIAPRPDYPELARAFGGYGETGQRPSEVRAALGEARRRRKGNLALIE